MRGVILFIVLCYTYTILILKLWDSVLGTSKYGDNICRPFHACLSKPLEGETQNDTRGRDFLSNNDRVITSNDLEMDSKMSYNGFFVKHYTKVDAEDVIRRCVLRNSSCTGVHRCCIDCARVYLDLQVLKQIYTDENQMWKDIYNEKKIRYKNAVNPTTNVAFNNFYSPPLYIIMLTLATISVIATVGSSCVKWSYSSYQDKSTRTGEQIRKNRLRYWLVGVTLFIIGSVLLVLTLYISIFTVVHLNMLRRCQFYLVAFTAWCVSIVMIDTYLLIKVIANCSSSTSYSSISQLVTIADNQNKEDVFDAELRAGDMLRKAGIIERLLLAVIDLVGLLLSFLVWPLIFGYFGALTIGMKVFIEL